MSIDTTDLSAARLRRVVADKMLPHGRPGKLAVTFMTFGFKHGTPRDADLTFDVRFLPNPHYEADLREQTGLDADVIHYVENSDGIGEFYARLAPLLDYLLPGLRAGGQVSPHGRHRLHRGPAPLGRDSRAPGTGIPGERRLHGGGGPQRRGEAATPALARSVRFRASAQNAKGRDDQTWP